LYSSSWYSLLSLLSFVKLAPAHHPLLVLIIHDIWLYRTGTLEVTAHNYHYSAYELWLLTWQQES
jgi:hypothetical protein